MLTRRNFLMTTGAAVTAWPVIGAQSPSTAPSLTASAAGSVPFPVDHVCVRGWIGERIDRAYAAMDNLAENTWWNVAEQWGYTLPAIWLRNVILFSRYGQTRHPLFEETRSRLIDVATRREYEIDYAKQKAGIYLDGEVITGLLACYDAYRDQAALEAAAIKGRFIVQNHHKTTHYYKGIAIERLVRLSQRTGDPQFQQTAVTFADELKTDFLQTEVGVHGAAASMIFDSYLVLYEEVGEQRYLDWAMTGWQAIRERMSVTGGIGEVLHFNRPPEESDLHTETCQTAWWMILNLHLWRLTGNTTYLDLAERILLNELLSQQLHRGEGAGFCALGDIDQGFRGDHNYFCCDGEGTFALLNLIENIYTRDLEARRLDVNLFVNSSVQIRTRDSGMVTVEQTTEYPYKGLVTLKFSTGAPVELELRLRIPSGAALGPVSVGGKALEVREKDSLLTVRRRWQNGDRLEVMFALPVRIEADCSGRGPAAVSVKLQDRQVQAKRIAVLNGPLVLTILRTGHGNDPSWAWNGDYPEVLDCGGSVFEGYPGSRGDLLEVGNEVYHTGSAVTGVEARFERRVPTIAWTSRLGPSVTIQRQLRVLPGLPTCLEYQDTVRGWDGSGRLLIGGLRFATVKTNSNPTYKARQVAWPYPFPAFSSKPDLSNCDDIIYQAGTFGLYESLEDGKELPNTGTFILNNGFFSTVSLYDPKTIRRVVCRRTANWVGIYLEPVPATEVKVTRRWFFPLPQQPASQSTIRSKAERAERVQADWRTRTDGTLELILSGPVLSGAALRLLRHPKLQLGQLIRGEHSASFILDYDGDQVVVQADVPGRYEVVRDRTGTT